MATFDFKCTLCDSVVEIRIVEGNEFPKCNECNVTMTKVFTPPAIHFKGGGWGGSHSG